MKVISTQLGYRPQHGRKRLLVPDVPEARSVFGDAIYWLFEQNELSKYSLNEDNRHSHKASLQREHGDLGTWLVGDFSHIKTPGIYQAYCGNTPSASFAIRDDVWCRVLPDMIRYFQVQSCGRKVVGWHEACHLDDGYIPELKKYVNAAGGWHDAGDFRKWTTSTSMNAISLLLAHRMWSGREEELGLTPGIFLDEARQGLEFFLGVQDEATGMLYQNVGGGRDTFHDNLENRFTDNIAASGDERRIQPNPSRPPAKFTTLYALYANALNDPRCIEAAIKSLRYDQQAGKPEAADDLQWRAWGYLELWRCTHKGEFQEAAVVTIRQMLALQDREHGFFWAAPGATTSHHKHVGADYIIWVLGEFLDAWPKHADAGKWKEAVRLWSENYARVFAARNAFGLLPYAFYRQPSAEHPRCHYRRLADDLYFRYFMADNPFGVNARCGIGAAALAMAARVLERSDLVDDAYRLLEWVVGNNSLQLSTMTGVGVKQPCALSFQMGNIPGGVTFGIGGDDADMPAYVAHEWACADEYYGYTTSQVLWGVVALKKSLQYNHGRWHITGDLRL